MKNIMWRRSRKSLVGFLVLPTVLGFLSVPVASAVNKSPQEISFASEDYLVEQNVVEQNYQKTLVTTTDEIEVEEGISLNIDGVGGIADAEIVEFREAAAPVIHQQPPMKEIIEGDMWSDQVDLPRWVDKAEADSAELIIADELNQQTRSAAHCRTFWPSPHQVCGGILQEYTRIGGSFSWLLSPVEPEQLNPDRRGYRQKFVNGWVYWSPEHGAHAIATHTFGVWAKHGWEAGWLGYPVGPEIPVNGTTVIDAELRHGWYQQFEGGRIYRTPITKAPMNYRVASVRGKILEKWSELGGTTGSLGFPIADETPTSDGVGRFSLFEYGAIYWHPDTGAWEVTDLTNLLWRNAGAESSRYGYPISAPRIENGWKIQAFSGGKISVPIKDTQDEFDCYRNSLYNALTNLYFGSFIFSCGETETVAKENRGIIEDPSDVLQILNEAYEDIIAKQFQRQRAVRCRDARYEKPVVKQRHIEVARRGTICYGQANRFSQLWSEELKYEVTNRLDNRTNHTVKARLINSVDQNAELVMNYEVLDDSDKQMNDPEDGDSVTAVSTYQSRSRYFLRDTENLSAVLRVYPRTFPGGDFHVQISQVELTVPSRRIHSIPVKLNFSPGRFNCPEYREINKRSTGDLCRFP